jgi:hypothetical protein
VFDEDTKIPRLFPPPLEYTLMVDPFKELNEKDEGESAPVPEAFTPVTADVPPVEAAELRTVKTHVRTFAVCAVVPGSEIPVRV